MIICILNDGAGGNPIDILEDASAEKYDIAIEVCEEDPNIDGIIIIYTP